MMKRVISCVSRCGVSEMCHQHTYDHGHCLHPQLREAALFEEQKELRIMQMPVIEPPREGDRSLLDSQMSLLLIGNIKRVHLECLMNLQYGLQDIKRLHRLPSRDCALLLYIKAEVERRIDTSRADRDRDHLGRMID